MTDLFKPEDFHIPGIHNSMDLHYSIKANRILQERLLSKAVRIYGVCDPSKFVVTEWSTGLSLQDALNDEYTHQALLISIEPIEKPKCEHEPQVFNDKGRFGIYIPYGADTSKCNKCGVLIKPTGWTELPETVESDE